MHPVTGLPALQVKAEIYCTLHSHMWMQQPLIVLVKYRWENNICATHLQFTPLS